MQSGYGNGRSRSSLIESALEAARTHLGIETGHAVGLEALARFAPDPKQSPQQAFAEAWEVGLGVELDLARGACRPRAAASAV